MSKLESDGKYFKFRGYKQLWPSWELIPLKNSSYFIGKNPFIRIK